MSRRLAVPAAPIAVAALLAGAAVAPAGALGAGPSHVTIHATPNPDAVGGPVAIYGQVSGASYANRAVVLWHRISGQSRFTPVSRTRTDGTGFYIFRRAEGVVRTNRNWFVRVGALRSRTVHELVYAEITLNGPSGSLLTNHPVTFTGKVTPGGAHAGDRIFLQAETGSNGDTWKTIDSGRVRGDGFYSITHRFREAGDRTVRVLLRRDNHNLASTSSPVSFTIQQAENAKFTLNASAVSIAAGDSVTLSGVLAGPNNAGRTVTLYANAAGPGGLKPVATTMTDGSGHYSFTQTPIYNAVYRAVAGKRHSALLYVGVRDVVTVTASATSAKVGDTVTFTGSVAPGKAGHVIYLQQRGDDGDFHTVQVRTVQPGSHYTLTHTFSTSGTKQFRVLVPGGPYNQRGLSDVVTITVSS